jgi:hypothetical protein
MLIYDNTLEPVTPRKITDTNDDCETIKFVYNTIKVKILIFLDHNGLELSKRRTK